MTGPVSSNGERMERDYLCDSVLVDEEALEVDDKNELKEEE